MKHNEWIVPQECANERADKVISKLEDLSRSYVQILMEKECILLNGNPCKPNTKVKENDHIVIEYEDETELDLEPQDLHLDVVYEDEDVIVINKPKGMIVHPTSGSQKDTLVNGLLYHCKDLSGINGVMRPGIVHRIDKDTTGLLIVAKNDKAHESLANQLKDKSVSRKYYALVHGVIAHDFGTIDAPIGRDPKDRQKMCVIAKNSKHAVTHFKVIERFKEYTLVECSLETGRTHQIRVHMQYIGHPVVGDPKYSYRKTMNCNGQLLHAHELTFVHPSTQEKMVVEAKLPLQFEEILNDLRSREV